MREKNKNRSATVQLTNRDLSLIRWINGFRFVEIFHIMQKWQVRKSTAYARVTKLIKSDYLIYERLLHDKNGIYRVSKKGAEAADDSLTPIKKINLSKYAHELAIVQLSLVLSKKYGDIFLPERRIKQQMEFSAIGQRGYISDGILKLGEKEDIAIEVEFSSKGKSRRQSILKYYTKHFEFKELWYFCGNEQIKQQLLLLVVNKPFVKLLDYHEFTKEALNTEVA